MNRLRYLGRLPYIFSSALLSTVASYIIYINISKDLNFEDFSKVSYWMNLGAIFTVLFDLGINQYLQVNYKKDIKTLSECLLGFKVVIGFIITVFLILFIRDINLFCFLLSFLFVSFQAFFSYYLRLQRKFIFDIAFNLSYYLIFVATFVFLLKKKEFNTTALFAQSHFIMRLILLLLIFCLFFFLFKQKVKLLSLVKERNQLYKIFGFSFLSILMVAMQNVDSLILYRTINDATLFSKISMVIKIGFLNFAFFDSFITLVSASEMKSEGENFSKSYKHFKVCLFFGILVSFSIYIITLFLPYLVGDKWKGIADISAWSVINNIALYILLFFQFKILSFGKVKIVALSIIFHILCSSIISYFFISYQLFFLLSAVLKVGIASYFIAEYYKTTQLDGKLKLRCSNI